MSRLRLVVLGLSLSSSWGNGHATTFRALLSAFAARGNHVVFLECDQPWYAANRDLPKPDFCDLRFYGGLDEMAGYRSLIEQADAVMVGSYVPDGIEVGRFVTDHAGGVTVFYDIDTPVTLAALAKNEYRYLAADLVGSYDLYLSFTGGPTLDLLERRYGAKAARALYCSVDATAYRPMDVPKRYDLGYLGTYSADRQPTLGRLLIEAARRAPDLSFVVAGPQYPQDIAWPANVERLDHVPPAEHAAFYNACRWTLNVTRADMIRAGYSPSVRLFEAAACGTPIISDAWPGIEELLAPQREIVLAASANEVLQELRAPEAGRRAMAEGARARVLAGHTAACRARELEMHLRSTMAMRRQGARRTSSFAGREIHAP